MKQKKTIVAILIALCLLILPISIILLNYTDTMQRLPSGGNGQGGVTNVDDLFPEEHSGDSLPDGEELPGGEVDGTDGQSGGPTDGQAPNGPGQGSDPSQGGSAGSQGGSSGEGQGGSSGGSSGGNGNTVVPSDEFRGVWVSYLEYQNLFAKKNEAGVKAAASSLCQNAAWQGLGTIVLQVRSFGDAIYPSTYYPWSADVTGTRGGDPGFDPLQVILDVAHSYGLKVHAWVNPYRGPRVSTGFAANDPFADWKDDPSKVVAWKNSQSAPSCFYLMPSSPEAKQLVVNGVTELVRNYAIDGIQFDDYFYPNPGATSINDGKAFDGLSSTQRRNQVSDLVRKVYSAIKSIRNIPFGISPSGDMSSCRNTSFAPVDQWMKSSGYIDYICPQLYWGYTHSSMAFSSTIRTWAGYSRSSSVRLYVGLGPYRLLDGSSDWATSDGAYLGRMVSDARASGYSGFCIYRYASLFSGDSRMAAERAYLRSILRR